MSTVSNSRARQRPGRVVLEGRYCRLEPIDPVRHGSQLFVASIGADAEDRFRYLSESPQRRAGFDAWLARVAAAEDPLVFAVVDRASQRCHGRQSLTRITPEHGTIEIADILWGPLIARTRVATEAVYLFSRFVFENLEYRRFVWCCDARNERAMSAAARFGFSYEGTFRKHMIVKGQSRDTVWFAMTDSDWPVIRGAFEQWLEPTNFDRSGRQKARLENLRGNAPPR